MENFKKKVYSDYNSHMVVCAQCGYRFAKGDEGYVIKATDDIIHRDCFMDYAEDNMAEFCDTVDF